MESGWRQWQWRWHWRRRQMADDSDDGGRRGGDGVGVGVLVSRVAVLASSGCASIIARAEPMSHVKWRYDMSIFVFYLKQFHF